MSGDHILKDDGCGIWTSFGAAEDKHENLRCKVAEFAETCSNCSIQLCCVRRRRGQRPMVAAVLDALKPCLPGRDQAEVQALKDAWSEVPGASARLNGLTFTPAPKAAPKAAPKDIQRVQGALGVRTNVDEDDDDAHEFMVALLQA